MGKTLKVKISTESISKAIADVNTYEQSIVSKTELFRKRVAEEISESAQRMFNASIVGDTLTGDVIMADVEVTVEPEGKVSVVVASGEDAVFVEFGAGVYYNGAVGSSPHPKGATFGYLIGSYGQGKGARKAWGYKGKDGEYHVTHGTVAKMPMYNACMDIVDELYMIAKEVFG